MFPYICNMTTLKRIILLSIGFLLPCLLCAGQDIFVSEQLSNPKITCFAQDSIGRIWIGTERGVNRYNGYDFHQFIDGAVPGNRINDILCDSKGRIWIGTDYGTALYDEAKGFVKIEVESEEKPVNQVFENPYGGQIFINLTEDLCVLDTLEGKFVLATPFFDRQFMYHQKCFIGTDSLMWVVGASTIRVFDPKTMANVNNCPVPVPALLSTVFDDGKILFGSGLRFFLFDCKTEECRRLENFGVDDDVDLVELISGREALIKTRSGRTYLFDEESAHLHPVDYGFGNDFNLSTVFIDRDGNMWAGSKANGMKTLFPDGRRFNSTESIRNSFSSKTVKSLCTDQKGNLWAFTENDGIFVYNDNLGTAIPIRAEGSGLTLDSDLLQTNPPQIYSDSYGRIWIVYPNQRKLHVCKFEDGSLKLLRSYDTYYPRCFTSDSQNNIWVGLRNEMVIKFDGHTLDPTTIQAFPFTNTSIEAICHIDGKIIVAAYNSNLCVIDSETGALSHLPYAGETESSLSRDNIFRPSALSYDGEFLWIGTVGDGLLKYSLSDATIQRIEGLPFNEVSAIQILSGKRMWISTPDKLYSFDYGKNKITAYAEEDGTGGDCFEKSASCRYQGKSILFGGTHGITEVNPDWTGNSDIGNNFIFEDIVTSDGRTEITGMERIVLNHDRNNFTISFADIDIYRQRHSNYSCFLEGFDNDWHEIGNVGKISYANLKPGKYLFKVSSLDAEHSIALIIKPSVWASWWMIVIYSTVVLLILGSMFEARRRISKEKASARAALAEKELEKKQSDMNMRFFSNISHEFRTPLTMIYGPAEQLASSSSLNEKERASVRTMQKSINRMLTLVNQLLDFGKIENDTLKLKTIYCDIVESTRLCCEPFKSSLIQNGINMNFTAPVPSIWGYADEDKLQKILSNLLSNAGKFTPKGGNVNITVRNDGPIVEIAVEDTGPGIPEDKLDKIFERYYQIDKDSAGKYNYGTGIGLYYARALAKVHHGSLISYNVPDGGAGFKLSIPTDADSFKPEEIAETGPTQDGPMETVPSLAGTADKDNDTRLCILVIDDDRDLLNYMSGLLSPRYKVILSEEAEKGLEIARSTSPDLILSDVMMPGMSGLDLCRQIKDDIQICHIPVILVTAKGAVDNQVEGLEQGADAYVTKPFSPSYLLALIRSQTDNRLRLQKNINQSTRLDELDSNDLSAKDKVFMKKLYDHMSHILDQEGSDIASIADSMGVSRTKFYYKIKSLTGKAPSEFMMQYRLNVATKLLKEGKMNVSEIAYAVGFSTLAHFSKCFKKQFGVPPSKYV